MARIEPHPRPGTPHLHAGRFAQRYARAVVACRHVVVLVWIGLVAAVLLTTSPAEGGPAARLQGFIDPSDRTLATEIESAKEFGFPLMSRTLLVQRDPDGLSPYAQAEVVLRALALNRGEYPEAEPVRGALPVTNTLEWFPASSERGTTALTYLFMDPEAGTGRQTGSAQRFAANHLEADDHYVGVTGSIPAREEQSHIISAALPMVERVTLVAIALVVALHFRSVLAPVLAIGTAGAAFLVTIRLAEIVGTFFDTTVPEELRPLVLALLLGVVTDYVIFYLSGMRRALNDGLPRLEAARTASGQYGPIVVVAGVTVAAGTAALAAADSPFFAAVAPAMALAVLVGVVVSTTLVPALMALLGRALFWPTRRPVLRPARVQAGQDRGIRFLTRRPVALVVVLTLTAGLAAASLPLRDLRLGVGFVQSLPETEPAGRAAAAAAEGFTPGIVAPTLLLVRGQDVTARRGELAELSAAVAAQPGVAGVLGPGTLPAELEDRLLLAPSGDAARYLVVFEDDPTGASAIAALRTLQQRLPELMTGAGLAGASWGLGGDTALASALVGITEGDLGRIALAALVVNLLILVLFLRALVAPLYLLASSVLALTASLGIATWVFQGLLGQDGMTFYVPFAAAVLLVALGSDYNVFAVGSIWAQARGRPLREAVVLSVPQSSRAITAAAVALALSFGALALVPLAPFRELAFVMALGIVLDAIVVRSLLVPTLLVLFGQVSGWPGRALSGRATAAATPVPAAPPGSP
ncbi:RND superfamily putative drug exporter [Kineococcus xinjiangensis]|uniref:RND superfamily putative drug exporter n=1 Tax=Kineococcus xinjiangensis TaxID=512762 RepID=A0A2S6IF90_9ACTN|nr:MMPL family transporter [Kineococcus xinjiangensis]PPK92878.1 RND superfamily putative drug exporter [Kineococcus xinjiangensis]